LPSADLLAAATKPSTYALVPFLSQKSISGLLCQVAESLASAIMGNASLKASP